MKNKGLSKEQAKKRISQYGLNELIREKKISPLKIFIEQFTSPLIILLIVSALALGIVNYLGDGESYLDTILIFVIIFVSGTSGFIQNYKAEKSIEALKRMSDARAKVIRDGEITLISSKEVVPGDVLVLEEGDDISADAKLIESNFLQVDESSLTGEAVAVNKKNKDKIYMNTYVLSGNALALVVSTGMKTRIGQIAHKIENIKEEKTPFYIQMDKLSKKLFWVVLVISIITASVGLFRYSITNSILLAIALAVAAVPEGLPAVLVLSLAVGSKAMLRRKALVRKLAVIESIGSVNYICTDKTGTITKSEMSITKIYSNNSETETNKIDKTKVNELFLCGTLNNNSKKINDNGIKLVGDETDVAIRKFGDKFGYDKKELDSKYKKVFEIPFDVKRKMMSIVVLASSSKKIIYSKGAPESIINRCSKILINGKVSELSEVRKKKIVEMNNKFASEGLRVIGFGYRELSSGFKKDSSIEKNLVFIGLEGIIDPPREGVSEAISECKTAGINVLMLTGDNPLTAKAIAKQVGILSNIVLTGEETEKKSDDELYSLIENGGRVFARMTPEHKLRIMTLLQNNGNIVAMTGDGVNDSLALKKADVGIAMGIRGTDVSKQASDLILLDDNFSTIVSAIREGRRIFDNIKKFTNYLLTSNFAEVAVILFATIFLTLKEPILLPIQLLWINLLTDGLPALALGIDPATKDIMKKSPQKKSEPVLNKRLSWLIGVIGTKKTIILFLTFFATFYLTHDYVIARTAIFTGFILYEFVRVAVIRHQENLGWFSNMYLTGSLILSLILQLIIIYTPLNKIFGIAPLGLGVWGILITGIVIGYFLAIWITNIIVKKTKE